MIALSDFNIDIEHLLFDVGVFGRTLLVLVYFLTKPYECFRVYEVDR